MGLGNGHMFSKNPVLIPEILAEDSLTEWVLHTPDDVLTAKAFQMSSVWRAGKARLYNGNYGTGWCDGMAHGMGGNHNPVFYNTCALKKLVLDYYRGEFVRMWHSQNENYWITTPGKAYRIGWP